MKPTLVILAAGIGSRYGGIKQLDGFGPNEERIIDYTVYDAMKAGYGKIVFVIRDAIERPFREAIYNKWREKMSMELVFQELENLPFGYDVPEGREKPWGTAHAVWMAINAVQEPFAIVNADDFYGRNSLKVAADYLSTLQVDEKAACMVGYQLKNTLTEAGTVSRGVCEADQKGNLKSITERTKIARNSEGIYFEENGQKSMLSEDTIVSMNLMGFTPLVFKQIAAGFPDVYEAAKTDLKKEYYIPSVLNEWIQQGVEVPLISTKDQWFGVTYSEDKPWVREQIKALHEQELYPDDLWEG